MSLRLHMDDRLPLLATAAILVSGTALMYRALRFPNSPRERTSSSFATSSKNSPHWNIYPEDFYPRGAYVDLPHGRTRYWLLGPEDGTRVVLVGGLTVPAYMWDKVARGLADRGYRVMVYDLYGRGYSDASEELVYDKTVYMTQLALLLQHVKWSSTCIAGVSMGGAIAAAFATTFPTLASSVALLCPTGLFVASDLPLSWRLGSVPFIRQIVAALPARSQPARRPEDVIVAAQRAFIPAFGHVIASTLRYGPVRGLERSFAHLGEQTTRVLVIWGTDDDSVPYEPFAGKVQGYLPNAQFLAITGAPHDLTLSDPDKVIAALAAFFASE